MKVRFTFIYVVVLFIGLPLKGQDNNLLQMLEDSMQHNNSSPALVTSTFQGTQLINMPTVEGQGKKELQFLIMHRFGRLSDGAYALFGLDNADIRFGLDYGITRFLSIGIGRSSFEKTYDGNFKLNLLRQKKGGFPFTVSLVEQLTHTTAPRKSEKPYLNARVRTAYASQLLIARRFSTRFSAQLTPTIVHYNMVPTPADKNTVFALGGGARYKVTRRISTIAEYNYLPGEPFVSYTAYNSLSLGMEVETGGHVFQFVFTNSRGMTAPYYVGKTAGSWGDGDIYFGFNISRSFNFNK